MDGRNRQRFQNDEQLLRAWISASTVLGRPRGGEVSAPAPEDVAPGGNTAPTNDVRPAA
jgi:hypothetical protein